MSQNDRYYEPPDEIDDDLELWDDTGPDFEYLDELNEDARRYRQELDEQHQHDLEEERARIERAEAEALEETQETWANHPTRLGNQGEHE